MQLPFLPAAPWKLEPPTGLKVIFPQPTTAVISWDALVNLDPNSRILGYSYRFHTDNKVKTGYTSGQVNTTISFTNLIPCTLGYYAFALAGFNKYGVGKYTPLLSFSTPSSRKYVLPYHFEPHWYNNEPTFSYQLLPFLFICMIQHNNCIYVHLFSIVQGSKHYKGKLHSGK